MWPHDINKYDNEREESYTPCQKEWELSFSGDIGKTISTYRWESQFKNAV